MCKDRWHVAQDGTGSDALASTYAPCEVLSLGCARTSFGSFSFGSFSAWNTILIGSCGARRSRAGDARGRFKALARRLRASAGGASWFCRRAATSSRNCLLMMLRIAVLMGGTEKELSTHLLGHFGSSPCAFSKYSTMQWRQKVWHRSP